MNPRPSRKFTIVDAMVLVGATALGFAFLRMLGSEGFLFRSETMTSGYAHMAQCVNEVAFPFLVCWTAAGLALNLRWPRPRPRRMASQPGMAACSAAALVVFVPLLFIVTNEMVSSIRTIGGRSTLYNVLGIRPDVPPAAVHELAAGTSLSYGPPTNDPFKAVAGEAPAQVPPAVASFPVLYSPHVVPHDPFPFWYISSALHVKIIPRTHALCAVAGAWLTLLMAGRWRPERTWLDRFGRAVGVGWIAVGLAYQGTSYFFP